MLIIDIREVTLLAGSGARMLLNTRRRCEARGAHCYVYATPSHPALSVLSRLDSTAALRVVSDTTFILAGDRP